MSIRKLLGLALFVCAAVAMLSTWGGPARYVGNMPMASVIGDIPALAAVLEQQTTPETTEILVSHAQADSERENLQCLALNIYWEARSEPMAGQLAVAAVTLNRVQDPRFPNDICSVVRQGGEVRRHGCQFSWWCDGKDDEPLEPDAWRRAMTLARLTTAGIVDDPTRGALWYHADYVSPDWAQSMEQVTRIGRHIFYVGPTRLQVSQNTLTELAQR